MSCQMEMQRLTLPETNSSHQPESPSTSKLHQITLLPKFLFKNPSIILAFVGGLLCNLGCFVFTLWLSGKKFSCPAWAIRCEVDPKVKWIALHYGLVQGIVSAISGIGLAAMGYAALQLGQTTLWPILHKQWLTLAELDTHVLASSGSIPSLVRALASVRSAEAFTTILLVAIVVASQQANAVVIGLVFTKADVTTVFYSSQPVGSGIGFTFSQRNPPGPIPVPVTAASTLYTSWSNGYSEEPLHEFRDYLFDRKAFASLTNFSITTVKAQKNISCNGFHLNIKDDPKKHIKYLHVQTHRNDSEWIKILTEQRTTLWVDKIEYMDETRTISTLVFAAIDGNIENGVNTTAPEWMRNAGEKSINTISAVACAVDITLVDNQHVGVDWKDSQPANVSSFATIAGPTSSKHHSRHGEVAAWLGVAITSFGVNVRGAQPMFEMSDGNDTSLPTAWNTVVTHVRGSGNKWTISQIKNFIEVGSGALGMSLGRFPNDKGHVEVQTRQLTSRMDPARPYFLLYLAAPVLAVILALAGFSVWVHFHEEIPSMNTVNVMEIIVRSKVLDLKKPLNDAQNETEIREVKVNYRRVSDDGAEFGLCAAKEGFDER
ncbi:uncharacterized protein BKCO1_4000245 [Diplodia corticola]|uniref:Uncharacterized protein n=1 Tax=Diplodia corticola TaxID=236234 RepID=A0A1J9S192_9PEZI|nr:uncharacterized protein BKCO1_4000245 [Diplodia corticola]OJD38715.1 hypothetical protein BKCO1_4000245 [Diplodia corticola]